MGSMPFISETSHVSKPYVVKYYKINVSILCFELSVGTFFGIRFQESFKHIWIWKCECMHIAGHFSMLRKCLLEIGSNSSFDIVTFSFSLGWCTEGDECCSLASRWQSSVLQWPVRVLWWIILFCSSFFCILWIFKFFGVVEQCFRCDLHLYLVTSRLWKSNRNGSYYMLGKHENSDCFILSEW